VAGRRIFPNKRAVASLSAPLGARHYAAFAITRSKIVLTAARNVKLLNRSARVQTVGTLAPAKWRYFTHMQPPDRAAVKADRHSVLVLGPRQGKSMLGF
jgi:hypothetical protein